MVGGADEGTGFDDLESCSQPKDFPLREFFRGDPTVDRQVLGGRLQVLADGQDGHSVVDEVLHGPGDLVLRLADPEHDAGLGRESAGGGMAEDESGAIIAGLDADGLLQPFHCLDVVIEDVRLRVENGIQVGRPALQVGNEDLNAAMGTAVADRADGLRPDGGASVPELVAGDRGDHAVAEIHPGNRFGHPGGFSEINFAGPACLDRAEAAGTGADIAEDHDGGGAARPAFPHVRALGALTDRVQVIVVDEVAHLGCIRVRKAVWLEARWVFACPSACRVAGECGNSSRNHRHFVLPTPAHCV